MCILYEGTYCNQPKHIFLDKYGTQKAVKPQQGLAMS